MENIGSLAILLAFCFAIYAVVASLAGKWAKRPFLILSAERAVYSIWGVARRRRGHADLFADPRRFPHGLRVGPQQPRDAVHLQVHFVVGRPGRFAAAVDLAAGVLLVRGRYSRTAASSGT